MAIVDVPAPMAGSVKQLLVAAGDKVQVRQEIVLIESMKMEIPVESPAAGTITEILVSAPQRLDEGQLLLRIETA